MSIEVLLADDDDSIRLVLSKALTRAGHTVKATDNPETLLKWAEAGRGDVIVTDVLMDGKEVFETLPAIAQARPETPIIIISANSTVVTALKSGSHEVFEYLPKPFDLEDINSAVERAGRSVSAKLRKPANLNVLPMIGRSAAMQPVYRAISRYANASLPVLIQGAVGTGKDLVASLLHDGGYRRGRPFLRTREFSNLSLTLQKVNGGDIFVDEVAGLDSAGQAALLEIMTEAEAIPERERPRVIASTRTDIRNLSEEGRFRDDLYYRIAVAEISLPPLSDRTEDIAEIAEHFLAQTGGSGRRRFETEALDVLQRHEWQGNVRELHNVVRRLSVLYSDDIIKADMLLAELDKDALQRGDDLESKLGAMLKTSCRRLIREGTGSEITPHQQAMAWVEKPLIEEALRATGGNRARAAEMLGIHRNTLRTRIAALGLS